jgi:CHASE3 domain sensor protein
VGYGGPWPARNAQRSDSEASPGKPQRTRYDDPMESGGLGDLFGDPEELQRRLAEFAEQMQGQQSLAWADNAIKLAVEMTVAAVERVNLQGNAESQAEQIRTVMARVFPEAVTLVREARAGLQ